MLQVAQKGAMIAVEVLPMLEKEAKDRQGTRTDTLEQTCNIKEIIPESNKGQARDQAAKLLKTNGKYVDAATFLLLGGGLGRSPKVRTTEQS